MQCIVVIFLNKLMIFYLKVSKFKILSLKNRKNPTELSFYTLE